MNNLGIKNKSSVAANSKSSQQGIVLLEALIAILLFSMGVLALVGLQAAMLQNTADSKFRAEASLIAQQRLGIMWSDPANAASGKYLVANSDIATLLPNGKLTITQPAPNRFVVTITWQQSGEAQHNFTTSANIAGGI
jgi:type IV pilus assembly protein PilV